VPCHSIETHMLTQCPRNWKPDVTEDDGSTVIEKHWGAMYANRTRKYELICGSGTNDHDSTTEPSVGPCKR